MKTKYILPLLAVAALTACDDDWYTEDHFGKDSELWQATQVNNLTITLSATDYQTVASNSTNREMATAAGVLDQLDKVASEGAFSGDITAADYLPAVFPTLVGGNSTYYSMTEGSTIKICYQQINDSTIDETAYIQTSSVGEGEYLLGVSGEEQVLAHQNRSTATYNYGRIYLSGNDSRGLDAVTRLSDEAVKMDEVSESYVYEFSSAGDGNYFVTGPDGNFLYSLGSYQTFQYGDDLSELDDITYGEWSITANSDGTINMVNVGTAQVVRYDTSYGNVQMYSADADISGTSALTLYTSGQYVAVVDGEPQEEDITFTLEAEGDELVWVTKGDYLNQALTGMTATTSADDLYSSTGWFISAATSIGELSYVWRLDATYGLRASAYANSTYYATTVYAISPALNLKKASEPVFQFDEAQKYSGSPIGDYLQVVVSTNYSEGAAATSATWTDVTDDLVGTRPDGSSWDYSTIQLDLSDYAGEGDVRVAFRYVSTTSYAATWEIKNVRCAEAGDFDE